MSGRQRVKICGISDPVSARVAVEAGADYIGVNFYPGSHRYIEPEQAREVADAARESDGDQQVQIVGLFVNEPLEEVLRVHEIVRLDLIQLSGDEPPMYMAALSAHDVPFIGTIRAGDDSDRTAIEGRFEEIVEQEPYAVILDTHVPGMWGGSGVVGDWELARDLAGRHRLILAGGLDPSNVAAAVREVDPYMVDVSSGVETNKIKDHEKIRAFIAAARGAEGEER